MDVLPRLRRSKPDGEACFGALRSLRASEFGSRSAHTEAQRHGGEQIFHSVPLCFCASSGPLCESFFMHRPLVLSASVNDYAGVSPARRPQSGGARCNSVAAASCTLQTLFNAETRRAAETQGAEYEEPREGRGITTKARRARRGTEPDTPFELFVASW
jgi:hypothetical protein